MITLEDAAKMTYDSYKVQIAKLQYDYLKAHEELKAAKDNETELLKSFIGQLPQDFNNITEYASSMEAADLRENLSKILNYTLSLTNKCIAAKTKESSLKVTYFAYNKLRMLEILDELPGVIDEKKKEELMVEYLNRMGIFISEKME